MLDAWDDLFNIVKNVSLTDSEDTILWNYDSKGVYTVKSFYNIVNFRGVLPTNIPVIWKFKIPPRIQIFLWLLTKNKLLTRDNLQKRQNVDDATCLFCKEPESIHHLFFDCVVSVELWRVISDMSNYTNELTSVAMLEWWTRNCNRTADVMFHSAALWTLWRYRNDMCFNHVPWIGMEVLWRKAASTLATWEVLCSGPVKERILFLVQKLEQLARALPLLLWPDPG